MKAFCRTELKRRDRIIINGEMAYQTSLIDGYKVYSGNVIANRIKKLQRFDQEIEQQVIENQ